MPDAAFWKRSVARPNRADIDPVVDVPFRISREDRIATAGSCFAQHIARRLDAAGYRYLVTEPAHPILSEETAKRFNYGTFTARYGNLYTARQLFQLFERAYGRFVPKDDCWVEADGSFVDPFRPQIQPNGFASREEFDVDRRKHLRAVREAFETLDVFVFTLGLTEAWTSREDGAVYPVCPGVSGGTFDAERHQFVNFWPEEIAADLASFLAGLRAVNPKSRVILTVSPVPLVATASGAHVLTATTYSKAALRCAAERIARTQENVLYFPSYEIVTGLHAGNAYFLADLRSVAEEGVSHVMDVFFRRVGEGGEGAPRSATPDRRRIEDERRSEIERLNQVACDEIALDPDEMGRRSAASSSSG